MEPLVTVKVVRDRYGCSLPTARKYIRQCNPHMENPLAAPEWAFRDWEASRTVVASPEREEIIRRVKNGQRVIVPRRRANK